MSKTTAAQTAVQSTEQKKAAKKPVKLFELSTEELSLVTGGIGVVQTSPNPQK